MIINLNYSSVKVKLIYKTKDKEIKFKRQQQKLYK